LCSYRFRVEISLLWAIFKLRHHKICGILLVSTKLFSLNLWRFREKVILSHFWSFLFLLCFEIFLFSFLLKLVICQKMCEIISVIYSEKIRFSRAHQAKKGKQNPHKKHKGVWASSQIKSYPKKDKEKRIKWRRKTVINAHSSQNTKNK
jgi:hypothetical protein